MLTGLARDGGLYVPEVWPQLSHDTIAGFFGRPYWEVAVDVIRPFAAGEISDADLGRMANEAYATFRHPAVVPLRQTGTSQFVLELFHGPTFAFKDVALQLISRLFVTGPRQAFADAPPSWSRPRRHRFGAASRPGGLANVDVIVLLPAWPRLRGAAPQMTTVGHRQCANLALEGSFRRSPGIVKCAVRPHRLCDAVSACRASILSTWYVSLRKCVYYSTSTARSAPRAHGDFMVPTGNFGDIFAGEVATRMGLPMPRLRDRGQRQRHPAARAHDRRLRSGAVHSTAAPLDGHPGVSNFEGRCSRPVDRDADCVRRHDGLAHAVHAATFVLREGAISQRKVPPVLTNREEL